MAVNKHSTPTYTYVHTVHTSIHNTPGENVLSKYLPLKLHQQMIAFRKYSTKEASELMKINEGWKPSHQLLDSKVKVIAMN